MSSLAFMSSWTLLAASTVACPEDYHEKGLRLYFSRKFEASIWLGKFVSSTFDKKRMIPYISFIALTRP